MRREIERRRIKNGERFVFFPLQRRSWSICYGVKKECSNGRMLCTRIVQSDIRRTREARGTSRRRERKRRKSEGRAKGEKNKFKWRRKKK